MKVLRIENRQKTRAINTRFFRKVLRHVLEEFLELNDYEAAVHLVSAKRMAELNENFLNHTGSTDVISFDYSTGYEEKMGNSAAGLNGEIFISVEDAIEQAREFGTRWEQEVARYAVHGFLHLLGFEDLENAQRREMKRRENGLMKQVEKEFKLRQLSQ